MYYLYACSLVVIKAMIHCRHTSLFKISRQEINGSNRTTYFLGSAWDSRKFVSCRKIDWQYCRSESTNNEETIICASISNLSNLILVNGINHVQTKRCGPQIPPGNYALSVFCQEAALRRKIGLRYLFYYIFQNYVYDVIKHGLFSVFAWDCWLTEFFEAIGCLIFVFFFVISVNVLKYFRLRTFLKYTIIKFVLFFILFFLTFRVY